MSVDLFKPMKWVKGDYDFKCSLKQIAENFSNRYPTLGRFLEDSVHNVDIPSLPDLNKTHKLKGGGDFNVSEKLSINGAEYLYGRVGVAPTMWVRSYDNIWSNYYDAHDLIPIEPKKKKWTTVIYETMTGKRFTDTFIGEFNEPYGAKIIKSFEWEEEIE